MTIATISDGKMMDVLHGAAAVGFFICWTLALFMIRNTLKKINKVNSLAVDSCSLALKNIICGFIMVTLIINGFLAIFSDPLKDNDPYIDVIEWVIFFGISLFIWTFSIDWKD